MMRRFSRRMFGSLLLSTLAVPAVQAAQRVWDVIVVGAGGAGLSAAVSAAEAGAKSAAVGEDAAYRRQYPNFGRILCLC